MRQLLLAAGIVSTALAVASWVTAQGPAMPGQVVGSGYAMSSVGQQFPQAAPAVGQPINIPQDSPLMRRYDPNDPYAAFKGTNIDPRSVVAPVAGLGGTSTSDANMMVRFYENMKVILGMSKPMEMPRTMVTPGIFRRNRERREQAEERMWRRD